MLSENPMEKLITENRRFVTGNLNHPNQNAERRDELPSGQYPFTALVCCSGSRVPPKIVFDCRLGDLLRSRMEELCQRNDAVFEDVRGRGLLLGLKCKIPNMDLVNAMRQKGVLVPPAGENVMRMLPPLTIDESHLDEAISTLEDVCRELGQ